MMCPKCGGLIPEPNKVYGYAGKFCTGHVNNVSAWIPPVVKKCDHCYCKKTEDGHKQCCNCGNRQIVL